MCLLRPWRSALASRRNTRGRAQRSPWLHPLPRRGLQAAAPAPRPALQGTVRPLKDVLLGSPSPAAGHRELQTLRQPGGVRAEDSTGFLPHRGLYSQGAALQPPSPATKGPWQDHTRFICKSQPCTEPKEGADGYAKPSDFNSPRHELNEYNTSQLIYLQLTTSSATLELGTVQSPKHSSVIVPGFISPHIFNCGQ